MLLLTTGVDPEAPHNSHNPQSLIPWGGEHIQPGAPAALNPGSLPRAAAVAAGSDSFSVAVATKAKAAAEAPVASSSSLQTAHGATATVSGDVSFAPLQGGEDPQGALAMAGANGSLGGRGRSVELPTFTSNATSASLQGDK